MEAQVLALQVAHEAESRAFEREVEHAAGSDKAVLLAREEMADQRWAFTPPVKGKPLVNGQRR